MYGSGKLYTLNSNYEVLKKFITHFMKKYIFAGVLIMVLLSCNDGNNNSNSSDTMKTNASATDSTQTPNGVTTGDVISVDTAATRLDTTQHK